ncbi:hypothetical protein PRZ48_002157 [Zasmidium cellare]|uniref:RRM domain-containing protein n=1 Tax=Zasmidium cellare TaxID=395010 RepID=A0ABR0F384_ZASCE|nr:hypothetical protein PRZ48_002157 [Zasmidium cellare]
MVLSRSSRLFLLSNTATSNRIFQQKIHHPRSSSQHSDTLPSDQWIVLHSHRVPWNRPREPKYLVELPQQQPVIDTVEYAWSVDQEQDEDAEWPTCNMYGNLDDMYGTNPDYGNNSNYYYYAAGHNGYPTLRNGNTGQPQANGLPNGLPPPAGHVPAPYNGYAAPPYAYGHPNSYAARAAAARNGGYGGPPTPSPAPGGNRSFAPTPVAGRMDHFARPSNMRFNPNAPRYVPTPVHGQQQGHMLEPVIRPESSISNHTFATQMPGGRPVEMAHPTPRRTFTYTGAQALGDGTNGLGAQLNNLSIEDHRPYGAPSTIAESNANEDGMSAQSGAVVRRSDGNRSPSSRSQISRGTTPSSQFLAQEIMAGKTEDPRDQARMNRYTSSAKLPQPTMGPARYSDLKMFGKVERNVSASAIDSLSLRPHQELPPAPRPDWLDLAWDGMMKPTLEEAFESLPMTELCRSVNPTTGGVIRVSDIPYTATKQELTAFVGRQAQMNRMPAGSPYHAVHILMERESGKTLDCFIEVASASEATWCMRQLNKRAEDGRPPKVGSRMVQVTTCTQDELMAELFPRAKHVRWVRGQPIVDKSKKQYYAHSPADGFSGFVHTEEFHAMMKHANQSERAPFISKSPCRVWEMMITMLYKYPWFAPDLISVRERRAMYDCAAQLIRCLCDYVRKHEFDKNPPPLEPNKALLQELVAAALFCPGFSDKQKAYLYGEVKNKGFSSIANCKAINIAVGGMHPLAIYWPFSALSVYPGVNYKLVEYYARLFREATAAGQSGSAVSLAARQMAKSTGYDTQPMGDLSFAYGDQPDTMTLAEIAQVEYQTIEQLLKVICHDPAHVGNGKAPSAPTSVGPDNGNGRGSSVSSTHAHSL